MYSDNDNPKGLGLPIQKSTDQRLLSPPRSLSQSATSFIASIRQGIHQMLLKRLIEITLTHAEINQRSIKAHEKDQIVFKTKFIHINNVKQQACNAGTLCKRGSLFFPDIMSQIRAYEVSGGGRGDRTHDLKLAKLPLSQLSYAPGIVCNLPLVSGGPGKT